jgi:hypothetical protein
MFKEPARRRRERRDAASFFNFNNNKITSLTELIKVTVELYWQN